MRGEWWITHGIKKGRLCRLLRLRTTASPKTTNYSPLKFNVTRTGSKPARAKLLQRRQRAHILPFVLVRRTRKIEEQTHTGILVGVKINTKREIPFYKYLATYELTTARK